MTIHSEILLALEKESEKIKEVIDNSSKLMDNLGYWNGMLDGLETAMDIVRNRLSIFSSSTDS